MNTKELKEFLEDKLHEERGQHPDDVDWSKVSYIESLLAGVNANAEQYVDVVNHPPHYEREGAIECIKEMLMIFGIEEVMSFCKLNAWKYRYRSADKNGAQDIKKSDWYMRLYKYLNQGGDPMNVPI